MGDSKTRRSSRDKQLENGLVALENRVYGMRGIEIFRGHCASLYLHFRAATSVALRILARSMSVHELRAR
jgi:hypothetical protein